MKALHMVEEMIDPLNYLIHEDRSMEMVEKEIP